MWVWVPLCLFVSFCVCCVRALVRSFCTVFMCISVYVCVFVYVCVRFSGCYVCEHCFPPFKLRRICDGGCACCGPCSLSASFTVFRRPSRLMVTCLCSDLSMRCPPHEHLFLFAWTCMQPAQSFHQIAPAPVFSEGVQLTAAAAVLSCTEPGERTSA